MRKVLLGIALLTGFSVLGQISVTQTNPTAAQVQNAIAGSGVTITNMTINCGNNNANNPYALFTNGTNPMGIASGLVLTTGTTNNLASPASFNSSVNNSLPGNTNGNNLCGMASYNACEITFQIVPNCNVLSIEYVFGSEEYPEYVGSINDAFGFLLNGPNPSGGNYTNQNIALLPGTSTPVTINNVNNLTNSSYYNTNTANNFVYDGYTDVLMATANVVPCQTYTMTLGVYDAADQIYDSGVFIDFGGLSCPSAPTITATASNASACPGQAVTLTASGASTNNYTWTEPAGGSTLQSTTGNQVIATPTVTTTYTVSFPGPCQNYTATVTVNVGGGPNATITSTSNTIKCNPSSVTLTGQSTTPGATLTWSTPSGQTGQANPLNVTTPGTYTLTANTVGGNCPNNVTYTVLIDTVKPTATISNSGSSVLTCTLTSITLNGGSGTAGVSYNWTGPQTGSTQNLNVTQPGTYTLTVTDPTNGCTKTATYTVTQNNTPPNVGTSAASTVLTCTTNSIVVNGTSSTPNTTFTWTGPGGPVAGNPITVTNPGTYTVISTNPLNGCTSSTTIVITRDTVSPNLSLSPANPTITCGTNTVSLTANSTTNPVTYAWTAPPASPFGTTPTVTVSAGGTYTCVVTNPNNGCTKQATITVSSQGQFPTALINAVGSGTITCANNSVTLTGINSAPNGTAGPLAYLWSNGSTNPQITVPNSGIFPQTYTLIVTDQANGCVAQVQFTVQKDTIKPTANIVAGAPLLTCAVTSVQLTGNSNVGNATYSWSGGSAVPPNSTSVNQPGIYTVTVTNPTNGCSQTATYQVNQDTTKPSFNLPLFYQLTCVVSNVTLTGSSFNPSSGITYQWTGAGSGSNATLPTSTPGTYSLTVTNTQNGCQKTQTSVVVTNTVAPTSQAGNDITLSCKMPTASLNGNGFTNSPNGGVPTHVWNGPNPANNNPNYFIPSVGAGTYILTVTDTSNGCKGRDTVKVNPNPYFITVDAGINQSVYCYKPNATLTGFGYVNNTPNYYIYNWTSNGGVIDSTNYATAYVSAGSLNGIWYVLTITDTVTGCSKKDSAKVTSIPPPNAAFVLSPPGGIAPIDVTAINASTNANQYTWFVSGPAGYAHTVGTQNDSLKNLTEPGTYTVCLVSKTGPNCPDTTCQTFEVKPAFVVQPPNIFSPNGDGINETYDVTIVGVKEITIDIYDRWGKHVKTNTVSTPPDGKVTLWDGKRKDGKESSDGTYYYILNAKAINGKTFEQQGFITLLRSEKF